MYQCFVAEKKSSVGILRMNGRLPAEYTFANSTSSMAVRNAKLQTIQDGPVFWER
jgi:hypothetical protein